MTGDADSGRLIARVKIEKGNPGEDDDWIIFTFGDADPAGSPYLAWLKQLAWGRAAWTWEDVPSHTT